MTARLATRALLAILMVGGVVHDAASGTTDHRRLAAIVQPSPCKASPPRPADGSKAEAPHAAPPGTTAKALPPKPCDGRHW